ncbi:hypothetical protein ACFWUU_07700 [Kribbella sp. NPDC058693]|uniref:hypothetical protein n=1 Tax=Kribbella TaxID=182639 RepID=UPI0014850401|nr:hypothetical protein [Kribbella jiaozuonensis]
MTRSPELLRTITAVWAPGLNADLTAQSCALIFHPAPMDLVHFHVLLLEVIGLVLP